MSDPISDPSTSDPSTSDPSTSDPSTSDPSSLLRGAALSAILEEALAIPEEEVLTPRLDIPAAVLTALGAAPEIEVHRAAIEEAFGARGAEAVDRVVPLARGLNLAHGEYLATTAKDLEAGARELGEERARLVTDAEVLIKRKVLDPKALDALIGGQAYKDRQTDVTTLVSMFRMNWRAVVAHTKVTPADLDRAEAMMERFSSEHGERNQATAHTSEPARLRARAFTLFFRTYERVRKMLTYLRWHQGDADEIAPSLYAGRTRRSGDGDVELAPPPTTPVRPGMPGADPFVRT